MSGPRAYLPPVAWGDAGAGARLPLPEEVAHHLSRVLRLRPGDAVVLFDGAGREADAQVTDGHPLEVGLHRVRERPRLPGPEITLLVATLKADKLEWVAQKATELGVDRLQAVETERSVARPAAAAAQRRQQRLERIVQEAGRQCGRAWLPELRPVAPLVDVLAAPAAALSIVLWEEAEESLGLRARLTAAASPDSVEVLVGPEGGFSAEEIARVEAQGFQRASLGPTILRAETAAIAAVALVSAHVGRLG